MENNTSGQPTKAPLAARTIISSLLAIAAVSLTTAGPAEATGPVAAGPTPSAAACQSTIVSSSVTPKTVVLGTSQNKGIVLTAKVRKNGCRVNRVEMGLYGPNFVDTYDLSPVSTSSGVTTYDVGLRISPGDLPNSEAGQWSSFVTVWGESQPESKGPSFKILRAGRLTTNAAPEPIKKGKTITVKGSLKRANWDQGQYAGYGKRKVELQWRTTNGDYRRIKTVTSAKSGALKAKVKATKDGCYRFVFRGSSTTAPVVSAADCVDVK
ncbi:MAG: hypothetical protein ABWX96_19710 [Propionibacteriaceae bacterium]